MEEKRMLKIKEGWVRKCKTKAFNGFKNVGSYPINNYPADKYIKEAELIANNLFLEKNENGKVIDQNTWNLEFLGAMDKILSDKGMRVL